MPNITHSVIWIDRGRSPRIAPDPNFPNGKHIDSGERPACHILLPYMTEKNVGYWFIECQVCKTTAIITAASRPDDPRSLMLPCKETK